jgi:hypothetical protein
MNQPFSVGDAVIIRTVTMHLVGRVAEIYDGFGLRLEDAAWVADSGRWHQALKDGGLYEVEPFPAGCGVALGAIVDWAPWTHSLPMAQR